MLLWGLFVMNIYFVTLFILVVLRKQWVQMTEEVEAAGGRVFVFSSMHLCATVQELIHQLQQTFRDLNPLLA